MMVGSAIETFALSEFGVGGFWCPPSARGVDRSAQLTSGPARDSEVFPRVQRFRS